MVYWVADERLEGFHWLLGIIDGVVSRMGGEFSDYNKVEVHLNRFMGSSSSIGARRVRNVCIAFRAASGQNNLAG